jgi:hypothetical protein
VGKLSESCLQRLGLQVERPQVEGSDRRWREGIAGGGERLQLEGRDRRWRGAIAGGGERLQVEGSDRI